MSEDFKSLEKTIQSDKCLEPFLFFRNNALDIVKLAASDDPKRTQAARNLIYLAFEKWGWSVVKRLERMGRGKERSE